MRQDRFDILNQLLWSLIRKVNFLQNHQQDFGTGQLLTSAEIHTIEAVGKNPGLNVTELAHHLVVTKGAISQIAKKLEAKGLLRRYKEEKNSKEIRLTLTDLGITAFRRHADYHARLDQPIMEELDRLNQEQFDFLQYMLLRLNQGADLYIAHLEKQTQVKQGG